MNSILINKDVFEPIYNDLKFTIWNLVQLLLHQNIEIPKLQANENKQKHPPLNLCSRD